MLRRDYYGVPIGLNEIFADLDCRLFELKDYRAHVNVKSEPSDSNNVEANLALIKTEIFNFNTEEVIEKIEKILSIITELQNMGVGIVQNIQVDELYFDEPPNEDIREQSRERKKGIEFEEISGELKYYHEILSNLKAHIFGTGNKNDSLQNANAVTPIIIELTSEMKLPEVLKKAGPVKLDIYQSALLFNYFRYNNVIHNHSNKSLAKLLSILTGHSEQNLRTEKGFGAIADIKSDRIKNESDAVGDRYNLNRVKKVLQEIINEIDVDIMKESQRTAKKVTPL